MTRFGLGVDCPEGGSVSLRGLQLTGNLTGGNVDVGTGFTAEYQDCGVRTGLGTSTLTGSVTISQSVGAGTNGVDVEQSIKGRLIFGGVCDDFLNLDVVQRVAVNTPSQNGAGVSVTLDGAIADSEGNFFFNEAVSITPGTISVTIDQK